jgi:sodium/hydrogen exchanger 8
LKKFPEYEISILLLFAYGSYAFAESVGLSGIMSLFFNGIILSHYNSHNLSPTSQVTAHNIIKSFAVLCDFFVFLFIGMGIFTGQFKHWTFSFAIVCIILCLISRFFNIIPLSFIANLFRQKTIPRKMQLVMWFAGLRGAISFALVSNSRFYTIS